MIRFQDHQITDEAEYLARKDHQQSRRDFLGRSAIGSLGLGARALPLFTPMALSASEGADDELVPTEFRHITNYNNFYEFSTDKNAVAGLAQQLTTQPWQVEISGLFDKTGIFDIDDLTRGLPIDRRVYRLRCVEAWSMVIPWQGFELRALLERLGVQNGAKYIAFETALRRDEMPGTRFPVLNWPYREGLRLDEATHPLTILATGLYDKPLPKQNGAPLRLVVPWKYGFKSIKSITRISAVADEPYASWNQSAPREYGFYANVNPKVSHPRWSQSSERVIGAGLFGGRRETEMFNGYDEVASLYQGMDLAKFY